MGKVQLAVVVEQVEASQAAAITSIRPTKTAGSSVA
jgi:hypothetical protein